MDGWEGCEASVAWGESETSPRYRVPAGHGHQHCPSLVLMEKGWNRALEPVSPCSSPRGAGFCCHRLPPRGWGPLGMLQPSLDLVGYPYGKGLSSGKE